MNPEEQQAQQAQAADSGAANAAMEANAKEASLMLFNKILDQEKVEGAESDADKSKVAAENAAADKTAADEAAKKAAAAQSPDPEKKVDEKPPARRKPISKSDIAEVAGKAAAEAAAETIRQSDARRAETERVAAEAAKAADRVEIPEEFKEEVEKLQEAQRLYPKQYAGRDLAKEFINSTKQEREYEKKWRKENPGQELNWDDEEHKSFVSDNAVEVDSDHLKQAERSILREQAVAEAEARFENKYGGDLQEVRRAKSEAKLAPVRQQVDDAISKGLMEAVRPDLAESFEKDRSKAVEEIRADPIAMEAVSHVERWSLPALAASVRVFGAPELATKQDVETLVGAAVHAESIIAAAPRDQRPTADDGRKFATLSEFNNMSASAKSGHFTIRDEGLVAGIIIKAAQHQAGAIKADVEKRSEAYAVRMGYTKTASNTSQPTPTKPAQATPAAKPAPSVRTAPSAADSTNAEQKSINGIPKGFWDQIGIPST